MKVSIRIKELKALALSMAVKDVRYYLQGVYFDGDRAVSTDGHRITIIKGLFDENGKPGQATGFIVPDSCIKNVIKIHKVNDSVWLDFDNLTLGGIAFTPIDGKFPDYGRIIPTDIEGDKPSIINPNYLLDAYKAVDMFYDGTGTPKSIDNSSIEVMQNGEQVCVVYNPTQLDQNIIVLIMPVRGRQARNAKDSTINYYKPQLAAFIK